MPRSGYILVVDDEVDIVDLIVDFLQEEGYAVQGALNGDTALAAITAQSPAVILLDLFMPHPMGAGLWDHLQREEFSDIPVVLMTASPRAAEAIIEKGVAGYLAKPFDLEQLLACIAGYVCADNAQDQALPLYT
jgi:two-component system nitrogen regulation response regulator NtrX